MEGGGGGGGILRHVTFGISYHAKTKPIPLYSVAFPLVFGENLSLGFFHMFFLRAG